MSRVRVGQAIRTLVLLAGASATASAQSIVRAHVSGTVFDSVSMQPLGGALVRIVRADDPTVGRSATSDPAGRFAYDSVASGIWLATFLHPVLDSLRLEPGVVRLEIADSTAVTMPLSTPSVKALLVASCGNAAGDDVGLVVGSVRGADDEAAVPGAKVQLEWPEWVLGAKTLTTEMRRVTATTDSLGRYLLCGVPVASTLRAITWSGSDTTGDVHVTVPQNGHAVQDFALGVLATRVVVAADTVVVSSAVVPTAAGRVRPILRGTVRTPDGQPLPDAAVRVIGRGSPVRTSADGAFVIADAGSGTATVEARRIGYSPHRIPVVLRQAEPASVNLILPVERIQLDTVRVVAGKVVPNLVRGIERRWRTGLGKFLAADLIMERSTTFTSDALRGISGVFVITGSGVGNGVAMRGTDGRHCDPTVFIDGVYVSGGSSQLDTIINRDQAAAIEVYARPNLVPAEFYNRSNGCGVVAVWSKFATEHVPVIPTKSNRPRTD